MQRSKILLLSFAHFSNDINTGAIPALMPFLAAVYGFNYTEISIILFAYAMISSVSQPVFGFLADRFCARYLIAFGVFCTGIGVGLMGYVPWYWALCGCVVITALGSALFHPEGARLTNTLTTRNKATSMSLFAIGGNSGYALGPLAVGLVIPLCGLPGTAFFPVAGALAALVLLHAFGGNNTLGQAAPKAAGKPAGTNDWKAFGVLTGIVVSRSVLQTGFHSFLALYWVHEFGATASVGAAILSAYGIVGVASNLLGGMVSDRLGYVRILRITQLVLFPAVIAFVLCDSSWLSLAMALVIAVALYASFSPTVILGQTYLARNLGFSAGVTLGLSQTFGGLMLPVMGLIADNCGLDATFLFMSIFVVIGIASSFFLKKTQYN